MYLKFRLNRYNWFGQKLLAQHQYEDIIRLHQYLTKSANIDTEVDGVDEPHFQAQTSQYVRSTSEHISYINGLALVKTSTRLDEVIYSLQQLSFDKNNQYFLLLCQCLLYLGNYDSVVAICKQVINKEIDAVLVDDYETSQTFEGSKYDELKREEAQFREIKAKEEKRRLWLESVKPESFEFRKIFANINRNQLINEPRLWFIFGLCLEQQRQFKDAFFAIKVAANLAAGNLSDQMKGNDKAAAVTVRRDSQENEMQMTSMSSYYAPHLKYAEFCVKQKADYRSAIQALNQISQMFPQNYTLHPRLALLLSAQPNLNQANFAKSIEMISNLEMHSSSNRNPSSGYNRIATKFNSQQENLHFLETVYGSSETGDENRSNLTYLLIKSHMIINSIVQDSNKSTLVYRASSQTTIQPIDNELVGRADTLIEALKSSEIPCWASSSLWNNLGVCYLIKRRFIACLSCLIKASQLNSLDWRINYNLALACIHVGLYTKALISLLAAKNIYENQFKFKTRKLTKKEFRIDPAITTLTALCYDKLTEETEARASYIEVIRHQKGVPIISLINYLLFLHNKDSSDEQHVKLKLHLLDKIEQFWLQRNQHDCQFNDYLLDVARSIGDETFNSMQNQALKKTYAWTKG